MQQDQGVTFGPGCQPTASAVPASQSGIPNAGRHKCNCNLCERGRAFELMIRRLSPSKREYFERLYDHLMNVECELDMVNAAIADGTYVLASGIAARSDETLKAAQPERREPDPKETPVTQQPVRKEPPCH